MWMFGDLGAKVKPERVETALRAVARMVVAAEAYGQMR
jgi:hypothetical protein